MQIAMMSELVPAGDDLADGFRKRLGRVARYKERAGNVVSVQDIEHPIDPDPASELASGQDSGCAGLKTAHPRSHSVEIERQADRARIWARSCHASSLSGSDSSTIIRVASTLSRRRRHSQVRTPSPTSTHSRSMYGMMF